MTTSEHPLKRLTRLLTSGPIIGLRPAVGSPSTAEEGFPVHQFEDAICYLRWTGSEVPPVPPELMVELQSKHAASLFIDAMGPPGAIPNGKVKYRADGCEYHGSAAIARSVLQELPPATETVILAPASLATSPALTPMRRWLIEATNLSWVIYADGCLVPGVHDAMRFVVLVCRTGSASSDRARLLDLRKCGLEEWPREVKSAQKRGGGEVGRSIIVRGEDLMLVPWTYERFSVSYAKSQQDSAELGRLVPLSQFIKGASTGLHPVHDRGFLEPVSAEHETGLLSPPVGMIPVIGGRNVKANEIALPGKFWVKADRAREQVRVAPGDLLVRTLLSPSAVGPKMVVATVPSHLEAAIGDNVVSLRWHPFVSRQTRELLAAWLMSDRASQALAVAGTATSLTVSALLDLQVPEPSEAVQEALSHLLELESWYVERAEHVRRARREVLSTTSYRTAVRVLLDTQETEGQRVTAANDSQRFGYRVRNYCPHPIALRHERLQVEPHGKQRLDDILGCAEGVVHYLAVCSIAQLRALRPNESIPSRQLRSANSDTLRFSWGTSWAVFREAADASRNASEPLKLVIPEFSAPLAELVEIAEAAERPLRDQRNALAHQHTFPDSDLVNRCETMSELLDRLMAAVGFIADIPLVYARDYYIDSNSDERRARFEILRGASVAFERQERRVQEEIPRNALGLLDRAGRFHMFSPWILLQTCEVCKRPEIFLFNRFEDGEVTYIAMESGHPWRTTQTSATFGRLLAGPKVT